MIVFDLYHQNIYMTRQSNMYINYFIGYSFSFFLLQHTKNNLKGTNKPLYLNQIHTALGGHLDDMDSCILLSR